MSHRHFILHKPAGYLSQFVNNQNKRRNKKLLGLLGDFPEGTMAIGRLDEQSEGLLFLTTDGMVSEEVRRNKIEKEYYIQVDGVITEEAIAQMRAGLDIRIKGQYYRTLPCKALGLGADPNLPFAKRKIRGDSHGPTTWASVTLTEGKYRQVRKMSAAVGFPTLRLVRVRIGEIRIDNLGVGEYLEVEGF